MEGTEWQDPVAASAGAVQDWDPAAASAGAAQDWSEEGSASSFMASVDGYKTSLCSLYQSGYCALGNLCSFAHGEHELRPTVGTAVGASTAALPTGEVAVPLRQLEWRPGKGKDGKGLAPRIFPTTTAAGVGGKGSAGAGALDDSAESGDAAGGGGAGCKRFGSKGCVKGLGAEGQKGGKGCAKGKPSEMKAELCWNFQWGYCQRGKWCTWSHGEKDLKWKRELLAKEGDAGPASPALGSAALLPAGAVPAGAVPAGVALPVAAVPGIAGAGTATAGVVLAPRGLIPRIPAPRKMIAPAAATQEAPKGAICPKGHALSQYTVPHYGSGKTGTCDGCNRKMRTEETVMDCRICNWYLCPDCLPLQDLEEDMFEAIWKRFHDGRDRMGKIQIFRHTRETNPVDPPPPSWYTDQQYADICRDLRTSPKVGISRELLFLWYKRSGGGSIKKDFQTLFRS